MAKTLVHDLQVAAQDPAIQITDLLRKALVVARKLKLVEFADWINSELSGYESEDDVPPYRFLRGELRGLHPMHGKVPVMVEDPDFADRITRTKFVHPISELQEMVAVGKGGSYKFSTHTEAQLQASMEFPFPVFLDIPSNQLKRVVDRVRTTVLEWALRLEADGILGDEVTFSSGELSSAAAKAYSVTNFYGPIQQAQFQQGSPGSQQIMYMEGADLDAVGQFLTTLIEAVPELDLDADTQSELDAEIKTAESQLQSPKPKRRIVRAALRSIQDIVIGAAKSALTGKLIAELSQLLQ